MIEADAAPALSSAGRGRALATVSAILFLTFLDTTIVSVALADVQSTLHAGVSQLQWVVNGYALVFASLMIGMGTLGDRLGRKRVMLAGLAVFIVGSFVSALTPGDPHANVWFLIAGRGIMGVGAAACEPGTLSVLRHLYPERATRARALGVWAAVSALALALGPVFGGVLVGIGGWRNVFWFNLAAGAAIFVAALTTVPESADPVPARLDIPGLVLGPVALAPIIFAVILGETSGYAAPQIIALFAIGAAATLALAVAEQRSAAPIMDPRYLRRPAFSGALIVAFVSYFGIFSIFFLTALYLQEVLAYSAFRIATLFVPMAVAMIAASLFAGRWVARAGPRLPMAIGCLAAGAGVLLTDLALRGPVELATLALPLALAGLGFGIAVVPVTAVALGVVPPEHSGMAASATTTSRVLGSVVGVAVLGSLVNGHLTVGLSQRLAELGVPPVFRTVIINAVETGTVPSGGGAGGAEATYGPIVGKVIDAAFGAFHTGLSISLTVSGIMILASGLVAMFTLAPKRTEGDMFG
jgi:EmrB/QacA subfamily drug resistance transporter